MWTGTSDLALTASPHPALSPEGRGSGLSSSQPSPRARSERLSSNCGPLPSGERDAPICRERWLLLRIVGGFTASLRCPSRCRLARGAREQGWSPHSGRDHCLREPVEVAAARLAGKERGLGAQLLESLRRDGHAAAAAQVGLDHLGEREAAARLQEL